MSIIAKHYTLIINKSALQKLKISASTLYKLFSEHERSEDDFLFKISYQGVAHPTIYQQVLKLNLVADDHFYIVAEASKLTLPVPAWLDTDTIKGFQGKSYIPLIFFHKQENIPVLKLSEINMTLVNIPLPDVLFSDKRMSNFIIVEDFVEKREANLRSKGISKTISSKQKKDKLDIPTIIKNIFIRNKVKQ